MQLIEREIFRHLLKWLIMCKIWLFMLWEQGVEGSNPFAPTVENQGVTSDCDSFFVPILKNRTQKGHAFSKIFLSFPYDSL